MIYHMKNKEVIERLEICYELLETLNKKDNDQKVLDLWVIKSHITEILNAI